jgi:hypothetical protein
MGAADAAYRDELSRTFWAYRRKFASADDVFDLRYVDGKAPPVFKPTYADHNVLVPPGATPELASAIRNAIRRSHRHRWFASMRSSQALAQSVFAGLDSIDRLNALAGLAAEDGIPAFFEPASQMTLKLEHLTTGLREPTPTSVDVFLDGPHRVAVEVKFSESEFGCCSRTHLRPDRDKEKFEREFCDGSYTVQRNRTERCTLSELRIRYWDFVPDLLAWNRVEDHANCPLNRTYQLVRNVLAACLREDATLDTETAHALVIFDARNPAFHLGGKADAQWRATTDALRYPRLLRRISWRRIAAHLAQFHDLNWLTLGLREKYGIRGGDAVAASTLPANSLPPATTSEKRPSGRDGGK